MTQIKNLPIGSRVREKKSDTLFIVADHKHTGWRGTTLASDKVCLISCLDAAEPDNPDPDVNEFGNNIYSRSNIHQWLNSNEKKWYKPAHEYDAPPSENGIYSRTDVFESRYFDPDGIFAPPYAYDKLPGYLTRFDNRFVEMLEETPIYAHAPADPDIIHYGPPTGEIVTCKVFIPSSAELGFDDEVRAEGFIIRLFYEPRMRMCAPEDAAIHKSKDFVYKQSPVALWLRSPLGGSTNSAKIYQVEHKFGDVVGAALMPHPVSYAAGIRPIMNISDETLVSERDEEGIYTFIF